MRSLHNAASRIDEPSTARMNFRTKEHIKKAIQTAAALSGVDDSAFTMAAAYRAAMETIETHERTKLSTLDSAAFFEALDNPPEPSDRLVAAFRRYRETVLSK